MLRSVEPECQLGIWFTKIVDQTRQQTLLKVLKTIARHSKIKAKLGEFIDVFGACGFRSVAQFHVHGTAPPENRH